MMPTRTLILNHGRLWPKEGSWFNQTYLKVRPNETKSGLGNHLGKVLFGLPLDKKKSGRVWVLFYFYT